MKRLLNKVLILVTVFMFHSMNVIGQSIPIYFTITENDSTTVQVFEIINSEKEIKEIRFNVSNDIVIPINQKEYLIMFKPNNYYLIEFTGMNSKFTKNAYVKTSEAIKGFPLAATIDFKDSKALTVRYNNIKKMYEYLFYQQ